jgi:hypothetical protein
MPGTMFLGRILSKWELFSILSGNGQLKLADGSIAHLQSILREDGSGSSFILHVTMPNGKGQDLYVRTVD